MAAAFNGDPEKNVQMAAMQQLHPWMFPDYGYSSDSDAEDHGREREQPETEAILCNMMPGCPRYFLSGCLDVLVDWCPMFKFRYLFCHWVDNWSEDLGRRLKEGSQERERLRALAAAPAENPHESTPVAS